MDKERIVRKVYVENPENRGRQEPKKILKDDVMEGPKLMGQRSWKKGTRLKGVSAIVREVEIVSKDCSGKHFFPHNI